MTSIILITYSILAILIGFFSFIYSFGEGDDLKVSIVIGLTCGAIMPVVIIGVIILWLLPIVIPCATAIYLFG